MRKDALGNFKDDKEEEEKYFIHILVKIRKSFVPNSAQFKTRFYAKPHALLCDRALDKRAFKRGTRLTKTSMCWANDYRINTG